jgi:mannose-1-phosphate guanylyltransferase
LREYQAISPAVVTNAAHRFLVREQLAEIGIDADILLDPARRTPVRRSRPAPCSHIVLALAADHVMRDDGSFLAACRQRT